MCFLYDAPVFSSPQYQVVSAHISTNRVFEEISGLSMMGLKILAALEVRFQGHFTLTGICYSNTLHLALLSV